MATDLGSIRFTIEADSSDIAQAEGQLQRFDRSVQRAGRSTTQLASRGNTLSRNFRIQKGAIQQVGFQLQDFAVQVGSGTSALIAFGQQGSQLAGLLGPGGAILGAVIAIGSALGGAFLRGTEDASEGTRTLVERLNELELTYRDLTSAQVAYLGVLKDVSQAEFDQQVERSEERIKSLEQTLDAFQRGVQVRRGPGQPLVNLVSPQEAEEARTELLKINAELDTLRQEAGAAADTYDNLRFGFDEASEATAENRDQVTELVSALELQAETIGKTARETALYEAARLGANEADLKAINNSFDIIEAYKRQQEAQKALMASTKISERDDPLLQRIEAEKRGQDILLQQQKEYITARDSLDQSLVSSAENTVGNLANAVGALAGEQSNAYRAAFLAQQGFAIASAIVNTQLAAAAALAPPPIGLGPVAGLPYAATIEGLGAANVAIIAAQTIAGIAQSYDGARADGGQVQGGRSYLVGERGPELFTPGLTGQIANAKSMAANESGGVVVNVYNAPAGTRTEERMDNQGNRFVDVFISDMSNGGPMSKSMQTTFGLRRQGR